jgi:hypothetical protein
MCLVWLSEARENGIKKTWSAAIYTKAWTGFEGESLGRLGEKSILCGVDAWVDGAVWKYTIE